MVKFIWRAFLPKNMRQLLWKCRYSLGRKLMKQGIYTFDDDGFKTTHFVGFREDKKFNEAWKMANSSLPKAGTKIRYNIEWRAHICTWAASQILTSKLDYELKDSTSGEGGKNWGGLMAISLN